MRQLLYILFLFTSSAFAASQDGISGSGSSAAFPVYRTWAEEYVRANGGAVRYDPIGSSGGVKNIKARATDFGGSDVMLPRDELEKSQLVALPTVIIGVVPFYHLPGIRHEAITLNGPLLARIFLGEITRWDAREIRELNPNVKLPALPIKPVVRADGSGTTYNFSDYLAKINTSWRLQKGVANTIDWPKHFQGAKGSSGVVDTVVATPGAIGYVDYNYVVERNLTGARMLNAEGRVVSASPISFRAALSASAWQTSGDFSQTLTQQPGKESWPITMGTFALLPKIASQPERTLGAIRFFTWSFIHGDELAGRVNFVRLPDAVQAKAFRVLASITDIHGQPIGMSALHHILK